jgi:hypothetical protein
MAGLVPAIHALLCGTKDVDARDKRGHDGEGLGASQLEIALVSLRRDGFDLDFDTRTGKRLDDQKCGRRVMITHHSRAYAEILVQDRLVRDIDGELYNVFKSHVGRGENYTDALEDHLDLLQRVLGYGTVQARTNLSIAEQDSRVRGNFHGVRSMVGMGADSIVERMDRKHRRIPPQ